MLALGEVVKVNLRDLADHLPHELAGLHIVMRILEHVAHDAAAITGLPVTARSFRAGNSLPLTKAMRASPVIPSGSAAHVRHCNFTGTGE
jgi:hypothetical protein